MTTQIPVVIERVENNGYRARSGEPLVMTAERPSEAEAINKLRTLLQRQLESGIQVTIPTSVNPWLSFQGIFDPNDPPVKLWEETMAENRRKADAEDEAA